MTDEARMTTSEISALLDHKTTAATRSWIRNQGLKAKEIDLTTRENLYSRAEVEKAIAEMPRGPYEKTRPTEGEPAPHDHDRLEPEQPH